MFVNEDEIEDTISEETRLEMMEYSKLLRKEEESVPDEKRDELFPSFFEADKEE